MITKPTRFFLDTAFVQALLNRNDQYHKIAKACLSELRTAKEVAISTWLSSSGVTFQHHGRLDDRSDPD